MITLTVDDNEDVTVLMKHMLTKIDPKGVHMTALDPHDAVKLMSEEVHIIFLDIELPGINGIEIAKRLQHKYEKLNIIFITGNIEYSFPAYSVHPSGFLKKPIDEKDLLRELHHLRFPIAGAGGVITVRCSPFAVYEGGRQIVFKSSKTTELFAYLIYRNGKLCTNGELLTALWNGNLDKSGRLRQLVMDMKNSFAECGAENVVIKKYGNTGLDMSLIKVEGAPSEIAESYGWIV